MATTRAEGERVMLEPESLVAVLCELAYRDVWR